jgi:hypothetical protein
MSKSFAQVPKPPPLPAEVITAFERGGAGQDTRTRILPTVGNRAPTDVGDTGGLSSTTTNLENREPTIVVTGEDTKKGLGVATEQGRSERTRRLSIDLPESWHRRFKIACTKSDRKMIDEVTEFIKRRTVELESE